MSKLKCWGFEDKHFNNEIQLGCNFKKDVQTQMTWPLYISLIGLRFIYTHKLLITKIYCHEVVFCLICHHFFVTFDHFVTYAVEFY